MSPVPQLSRGDFALFHGLFSQEYGLYLDEDKSQFLRRALGDRVAKLELSSYQHYYDLLKSYPQGRMELAELLDSITPGETYFFRGHVQFDVLVAHVLPEMLSRNMNRGNKSIRVWSAGCSKGDEAYSIAIAIREALPSYAEWEISILGTDVNWKSLHYAQEACYGYHDIRHVPQGYLDTYFDKRGSNYLLHDDIKRMVGFEHHNLVNDLFTHDAMQHLDIIFCRNVTIYFDLETTKAVINKFYDCLCPEGVLFLGHAETLWQISDRFQSVEYPQTFVYKKVMHHIEEETMMPFIDLPEIQLRLGAPIEPTSPPQGDMPQGKAEAAKLSKTQTREYLTRAYIFASQGKYADAASILTEILHADNLAIEAYYFLGVLLYRTGELKAAQAQFRKVLYIDPSTILAYFNVGTIYVCQREFSKAALEFRNAVALLRKKEKSETIRFHKDFTAGFLLAVCEKYLEILVDKQRGGA